MFTSRQIETAAFECSRQGEVTRMRAAGLVRKRFVVGLDGTVRETTVSVRSVEIRG